MKTNTNVQQLKAEQLQRSIKSFFFLLLTRSPSWAEFRVELDFFCKMPAAYGMFDEFLTA